MRVICAWCGEFQGEKEPLKDKSETHGICKKCYRKEVVKMLIEKCSIFDECPKIKIILDKDMADDGQYAEEMLTVCKSCPGPRDIILQEVREMELAVKYFTKEEQQKYQEKFYMPMTPKDWGVIVAGTSNPIDDVLSFHDSVEQARTAIEESRQRDLIEGIFQEWVTKIASDKGISREKIIHFIR